MVRNETSRLFEEWKKKRFEEFDLDWYAGLTLEEMEFVDSWELVYRYAFNNGRQTMAELYKEG